MEHKSCSRCNAGMPSFRVNNLCEECYAEEWDGDYDGEIDEDNEPIGSCEECGSDLFAFEDEDEDDGEGVCDECRWRIANS